MTASPRAFGILIPLLLSTGLCVAAPSPPPSRVEELVETLHGVEVRDPYRWLEAGNSDEVRSWTAAQNAFTADRLRAIPLREQFEEALTKIMTVGSLGVPRPRGERLFFTRRDAGQKQPLLYVQAGASAPRVLVDVNPMSATGTVAMDWWAPSPGGEHLAYGLSEGGSEVSTLFISRVADGATLEDQIPRARAAQVSWDADGRGFYYCRYPAPDEVPTGEEVYHRRVYHHSLGASWLDDPEIYADPVKEAWTQARVSPDGRWLLVHAWYGHKQTRVLLRDLAEPGSDWRVVVDGPEVTVEAYVVDGRLIIHTDHEAPNFRVMTAGVNAPGIEHWRELVPEGPDALTGISLVGGQLIANTLRDAASRLLRFDIEGTFLGEMVLPGLGSSGSPTGEWGGDRAYYRFQSSLHPRTIYRLDLASGESTFHGAAVKEFDPAPYLVKQLWFTSKDGTRVPMFVTHRRDIELDGDNPVLLSGYGGFQVNATPRFSLSRTLLLDRGFVLAAPCLRGGGEYGEAWHEAGMLAEKQNTFDDFIAAGEHLIAEGYTRPERLGIVGGSNGGLLVGAVFVQRPELFGAAICAVPLLDMLRYHRFLIARLWIPEYGDPDDPEQFAWLHAYSPYHHVEPGSDYPAILLSAAESDSRVDPLHARKMAAALQAADTSPESPVLLRIEAAAGHGQGKPTSKVVAEIADEWSFLCHQLGVE
jgi:prolyl oligopeptidase